MSTLTTADRGQDESVVSWRDRLIVAAWSLAMSIVVFAPLLGSRGGVLRGELLFTPRQPFKGAWLGLDGSVPHNVPFEFLIAIGNWIVPGDFVQKFLLILALFLAGTGAAAAAARLGLAGQLVAATFFVWNPWVYERLSTGDLGFVFGYAALGWIVWAAQRPGVTDGWRGMAPVAVGLALAGWTSPTFGVIALLVAICVLAARSWETAFWAVFTGILVNLPWIVPGLTRPGGILPDTTGVAAYSANPDTRLGVFGSLLTLGGVWDPDATAPGRDNALIATIALVLTLLGVLGAALVWGRRARGPIIGLTVASVIGIAVALLGAYSGTRSAIEAIAENVPGGILLRDGHAWIAPFALLLAFGLGSLVTYLWELGGQTIGVVAAVVGIAAPIALLPGLALALDGNMKAEHYPGDWWETREFLASTDHAGVAVLPLSNDRDYAWNDNGEVRNPTPYFFLGDVLVDDSRTVVGAVVDGNDAMAAVLRGVAQGRATNLVPTLLQNGYDTLVVERRVRGSTPRLPGAAEQIHRSRNFVVYHLSGALGERPKPSPIPILIGDVLAAGAVLGALLVAFGWVGRRRDGDHDAAAIGDTESFERPEEGVTEEFTTVLPQSATVPTVATGALEFGSEDAVAEDAADHVASTFDAYAGYDPGGDAPTEAVAAVGDDAVDDAGAAVADVLPDASAAEDIVEDVVDDAAADAGGAADTALDSGGEAIDAAGEAVTDTLDDAGEDETRA